MLKVAIIVMLGLFVLLVGLMVWSLAVIASMPVPDMFVDHDLEVDNDVLLESA